MHKIVVMIFVIVLTVAGVYAVGIVLECEYPYWPLLWKARHGMTWDGKEIATVLESKYPRGTYRLRWHTCSYCWSLSNNWKAMPYIRVDISRRSRRDDDRTPLHSLHVFYRRADRVILPADRRTAKLFPGLMPPGWTFAEQTLGHIDGTRILPVKRSSPSTAPRKQPTYPSATSTPSPTPATSSAGSPRRPRPSPATR